MRFAKFVTEELKSPGDYGKLDYAIGSIIEVEADPKEEGQCAAGIHFFPLSENIDFTNVVFAPVLIELEVQEEDIVFSEGNGKMRASKIKVLREIPKNSDDWNLVRKAVLSDAQYAYRYARFVDKAPREDTRAAACKMSAWYAYHYALDVDKAPRDDTRKAVLNDAYYAYCYALDVDKAPRDDTREACIEEDGWAYEYALYVDKAPRDDTREAALNNVQYSYRYALDVDKAPRGDTRKAALNEARFAYLYARDVDKKAREDTRAAACKMDIWAAEYKKRFGE